MTRRPAGAASGSSPAWTCRAPQQSPPGPGEGDADAARLEHRVGRLVDVALPGVHHAPGEEPDVRSRSRPAAPGASGSGGSASREVSRAGHQPGPLGHGAGSAQGRRSSRWWPSSR